MIPMQTRPSAPRAPALAAGPPWIARQRARCLAEHWRIGVIDAPLHALLAPGPVPAIRWLTPREVAGYWADPFALPDDPDHVYAERYDERLGRGWIERLELRGDALVPLGPVSVRDAQGAAGALGGGLHASFPHVFEMDGERWAVAETGAARDCLLYRIDAAGAWHAPVALRLGVAAADPAIFRWQGRYWLAYTDADIGAHDNLCLFHATSLRGPWRAHAAQPVKTGRHGTRMAGRYFVHDGALYRPGQDCTAAYGGAVVLYRVDVCTPTAYRETPVRSVAPDPRGPLPHGLHTLSAWGERTLVDGKRLVFNPLTLARKLRARWHAHGVR